MKKILITALVLAGFTATAQVKVGDNATAPMSSGALLEMESTSKGLLISRMTTAQRTAITTPANGLQVFDTDTKSFWYFDATILPAPGAWVEKTSAKNAKWIDGTNAGDVVLNNPTADYVPTYTNKNYRYEKTSRPYIMVDNTTYNLKDLSHKNYTQTLSSDINTGTTGFANNFLVANVDYMQVNALENRNTAVLIAKSNRAFIEPDNANNLNRVTATEIYSRYEGTGTLNQLVGAEIISDHGNGIATNNKGLQVSVNKYSNSNVSNLIGIQADAIIRTNGNVTDIKAFQGNISNYGSPSNAIVSNASVFRADGNFDAQFTGTINNYYDYYANSTSSGGGTITNKYGFYIVGADKRNYLDGKLGIGIANPTAKLHVRNVAKTGTISTSGTTVTGTGTNFLTAFSVNDRIIANNEARTVTAIASNTQLTVSAAFGADLPAGSNYNNVSAVLETGNVGIGTSNPLERLHVNGDFRGIANQKFTADHNRFGAGALRITPTVNNAGAILTFLPTGTNTSSVIRLYNNSDANNTGLLTLQISNTSASIAAGTFGTGVKPSTLDIDQMHLKINSGTVGTDPAMLSIQSHNNAATNQGDFYAGINLGSRYGGNITGSQPVTAFIKAMDFRAGLTSNTDGGLAFGTLLNSEAAPSVKMVLSDAGNLGIGTSNPRTKLHVTGLPIYADNAAALAGLGGAGVAEGAFYHTGDGIVRVVY